MGESVWAWSKTAASNSTADSSINWAEGQSPGSVNNSARSMMAAIAKLRDDQGGALTLAGGTTAYTATTNQGLGSLADGARIHVVVNAVNTGAVTLNVDALGAKSLRKNVAGRATDIIAGEMQIDMHLILEYDASVNGATGAWIWLNAPTLPTPGAINGLILSNNATDATNDIDIAAGTATDSTDLVVLRLASAFTKKLDATWAVGTGAGGMESGTTKTADNWYFPYLILRPDTGVTDVVFSDDPAAPTLPTNYTIYRRLGAVYNNVSNVLAQFVQDGDHFQWKVGVADINAANPGTTAVLRTLSVPEGIRVLADISVIVQDTSPTAATIALISDPSITDSAVSTGTANMGFNTTDTSTQIQLQIMTNTSAQVRSRLNQSTADHTLLIYTHGWWDRREQD